ncbi:hypothetical protein V1511DRAFT_505806 [Dipodascopsis uninucleata]
MHPRNRYYNKYIDFHELSDEFSELRPFLNDHNCIDFKDTNAVCALTKAILKRDFDISITLDPNRLCPRIPNRLNYLLWVEDLLNSVADEKDHDRRRWGLDIGTGISCIYPLLGVRENSNWCFVATDIDDEAIQFANKNVSDNALEERIRIYKVSDTGPFFDHSFIKELEMLSFTVCNPPFYSSLEDYDKSLKLKKTSAQSYTAASTSEMITDGGETSFILRMISESRSLCLTDSKLVFENTWFTSMLGKLSSLKTITSYLKEMKIDNYVVSEFLQGGSTRRWAIAWRFDAHRPCNELVRPSKPPPSSAVRPLLPPPTSIDFSWESAYNADEALIKIFERLSSDFGESMELSVIVNDDKTKYIIGISEQGDVWSRKFRRRKRLKSLPEMVEVITNAVTNDVSFKFRISISSFTRHHSSVLVCSVAWSFGRSYSVFESFCGTMRTLCKSI